jgi:hypothetical protein
MSEVRLNFTDETALEAFEKQFSLAFPKLRVQLVRNKGNLKSSHPAKALEITGQTTVEQLEAEFKQQFSISATIFRLTGGSWIAVKQTRDWNLNDQNLEGGLV